MRSRQPHWELTLEDAKTVLHGLQRHLVTQQFEGYQQQQLTCPDCQHPRRIKDRRKLVYHSLFGKLQMQCDHLFHCDCQRHEKKSLSPLSDFLTERTAPELLYLETKFAALMSFEQTAKLLAEVLPIDEKLNAATVSNHAQQMAERLEAELDDEQLMFIDSCERDDIDKMSSVIIIREKTAVFFLIKFHKLKKTSCLRKLSVKHP